MKLPTVRVRGSSEIVDNLLKTLQKTGLTTSGAVIAGASVLGWIVAFWIGDRPVFLLVYGSLGILLIAWLLGRRRVNATADRTDIPTRAREGQIVDVGLKVRAERRLSTVVLEESLDPLLGPSVRVPVASLSPGQDLQHDYSFSPRLRGVYQIGPLRATWSDPFGMTKRSHVLSESVQIIVHPSTEPVVDRVSTREWEDPPIRPPLSKPWPTGFEFYGMRDYVPGDDPRRIIWRAAARSLDPDTGTGKIMVRESEQGITDRVILVMDTDQQVHSEGYPSETFEAAVRTVASLGDMHLRDGFAVTVETNDRPIAKELRGRSKRVHLLDELAKVQTTNASIEDCFRRFVISSRGNSHTVLVTTSVTDPVARFLRILLDRGGSVILALIHWEGTDPESAQRAASVGCNVVELEPRSPIGGGFQRLVGSGVGRNR